MPGPVVGMDEVGRGCWAGPLVVGAVVLDSAIYGVKDSKLLSRQQREKLNADIYEHAVATSLGWVDVDELNELGLTSGLCLAYQRALEGITVDVEQIIIDGKQNFLPGDGRIMTLIDADAIEPAVSAASIIAKVARDNYMRQIAAEYPHYGFEQHVGYGTLRHRLALNQYGICALHRLRYKPIRAVLEAA